MGANKVDFSLGNGPHSDLVKGTGEEGGKGRHKHDVPVPAPESNPHANHVLLGDETLDESLRAAVLVGESKRRVFRVSIKSDDPRVVFSQLHQSLSIRLPRGDLHTKNHPLSYTTFTNANIFFTNQIYCEKKHKSANFVKI